MAITYEDALSTLEAMFGDPWTRETLDAILRHEKGHMENTCERILNHGSEDPQILVKRLQEGGPEPQVAMDEALARQLQDGGAAAPAAKKGRGTPTELPADFLRIPGYNHRSSASRSQSASGGAAAPMDDETLARMLQDELFSEELARNPDFAHLARGGRARGNRSRSGNAPPGQRRSGASAAGAPGNPFENVKVMENLSKLGEGARRRLQLFATNFENRINGTPGAAPRSADALRENTGAAAERRGLLDDDGEEEIEFEMHEKKAN